MTLRRVLRIAARVALLAAGALLVYIGVTFLQVWNASNQDHHDPTEAIIVLGAAQYDGTPSPVLAGRLAHALSLYRDGVAPVIVVTGGKQTGDRFTEAAASFTYLRQHGVPEASILREEQGANTWEQLAAATRLLHIRNLRGAVLVSDDYHALRLERIANEIGLRAQVSPIDPHLSTGARIKAMTRETAAVAIGRIIGFRRLVNLEPR